MTKYQFEGSAVLVKPALSTESALVKTGVTVNAGNVVKDAGGADAGKYDVGTLDAVEVKGVAIDKRVGSATEDRPLTVARLGLVRVVADGAIAKGSSLKAGAAGKVKALAAADNRKLRIGRHEAADDGTYADVADGATLIAWIDVSEAGVEA